MRTGFAIAVLLFWSGLTKASLDVAIRAYEKNQGAAGAESMAYELYRSKLFFSATDFIKQHLANKRPTSKRLEKLLLDLTFRTGIPSFRGLKRGVYRHYKNSPTLNFILGLKLFQGGKHKESIKVLKKIPSSHVLAAESAFILGAAYVMLKQYSKAHSYYYQCRYYSEKRVASASNKRMRHYLLVIVENCITHRARIFYQQKKYQQALDLYHDIPKTSYLWPYLLLEKAWANYQLKNYNRSLGLLVTYKSPLLTDYFLPEADVLRALSYFRMCLWHESSKIVKEYYEVHLERSQHLKRILLRHKESHKYFLRLMRLPASGQKKINPFIGNLTTQISKKTKFRVDFDTMKRIQREFKYIGKLPRNRLTTRLKQHLSKTLQIHARGLNHYVKKQMFDFLNKMYRFSFEMSNIKLKGISYERASLYEGKKLTSKRMQGSLDNVSRSSKQYFYFFDGEFWADELGDYNFGLKSNCKKRRKNDA